MSVCAGAGAGKTSILRAIAGLWSRGSGSININVPEEQVRRQGSVVRWRLHVHMRVQRHLSA